MRLTAHIICLLMLVLLAGSMPVQAQQKPAPKLTPPVLQSFWGYTKGGELPLEMVLQLVDSSVWVISDKKERMRISRFILLYRSKDRYEDEETGAIRSRFNSSSVQVNNTALLPERWRKTLYENIKKEDELYISDIIVRDRNNEYLKAPDIRIIIR
ncbi:MAG TPA: hypothetical protein PKE07_05355 [Lacibacter sp.]|nr:hypothetical protein [Lacibacter sp.]HMO88954.1 hypothetical protein [Lacibacter sp.]